MPRRSPRRSRSKRFSGGVFGQSKTEYYIRTLGNMADFYYKSPYLKLCFDLYSSIFGNYNKYFTWYKLWGDKNHVHPETNMFGFTYKRNEAAERLIELYNEKPNESEAKERFKQGIHQIYSEVMARIAGPQRRSMFGHSYESIVPEQ
jgi:hypothetical protein